MIGFVAGLLATAFVVATILIAAGATPYLLGLVVVGLVAGWLGRLVAGPDPMGARRTLLVGVGGSFLGGMVGWFLFQGSSGLVLSVAGAAFVVWVTTRSLPET